jgi:hypothetical protein
VAGSVTQGLQQLSEQKAQPFTQTMGLQGLGKQAGIAGQIQAQQMARQQQMAQDPQAIAEMAARMIQPSQSGIANIPVDMQFKEGGIIGFDGTDSSYVKDEDAARISEEIEREFSRRFGAPPPKPDGSARIDTGPRINFSPVDTEFVEIDGERVPRTRRERELRERMESFRQEIERRRSGLREAGQFAEAQRELQRSAQPLAAGASRLEDYYIPYPQHEPMRSSTSGVASLVKPEDIGTQDQVHTLAESVKRGTTDQRAPSDQPPTAAGAPSGAPPSSRPSGVATISPPDMQQLALNAREIVGDAVAYQNKRLQDILSARSAKRKELPDVDKEGIANIMEARRQREELYRASKSDDNMRRFLAAMDSIRTGRNQYAETLDSLERRDELNRKAFADESKLIRDYRAAQNAAELGDFDRQFEIEKVISDSLKSYQTNAINAFSSLASSAGSIYGTQVRSEDEKRRRELDERKLSADIAASEETRRLREQRDKEIAIKALNDQIITARGKLATMKSDAQIQTIMADPKLREQFKDRVEQYTRTMANYEAEIAGLEAQRDQLSGVSTRYYDASGKPLKR